MIYPQSEKNDPRVAMVLARFYPVLGGTEMQALLLAQYLQKKGMELFVVTARLPRQKAYEEVDTVKIYRTASYFSGWIGSLIFMFSSFMFLWHRRRHFDIIHVFLAGSPALMAVLLGWLLHKKVILKFGGAGPTGDIGTSNKSLVGRTKLAILRKAVASFVVPTQEIGNEIKKQKISVTKIHHIANGVDIELFFPVSAVEKVHLRRALKMPGQNLVIYAGRLEKGKGVDLLLAGWPAVCHKFPDTHLLILGAGTLQASLEGSPEYLSCKEQVHFLGTVNEMPKYLQCADIYVLPSLAEGLSNALLEAMACSLPVVAADLPGNREIINNNVNGTLTKAGESGALSEAIVSLLLDKARAEKMGKQARETIVAAYSIQLITEQYKALYQTI